MESLDLKPIHGESDVNFEKTPLMDSIIRSALRCLSGTRETLISVPLGNPAQIDERIIALRGKDSYELVIKFIGVLDRGLMGKGSVLTIVWINKETQEIGSFRYSTQKKELSGYVTLKKEGSFTHEDFALWDRGGFINIFPVSTQKVQLIDLKRILVTIEDRNINYDMMTILQSIFTNRDASKS
jgi:hypothetical protein